MESSMYKSICTIVGAAFLLALGSLVSAQAGGGATSAPSKYSNVDEGKRGQASGYPITEFSSSSARRPKR
jgi:hypothetical protein